jgi:DNA mismatch endonuclease, patch repair protein
MMKENMPQINRKYNFDTTPERSVRMSNIRSKDTGPEIKLRKALWKSGIRYRINVKKLPGKPDVVIGSKKIAIFVDGEFWHGYNWDIKKEKIKANREYWIPKIERNIERDSQNNADLKNAGYTVLRFWEHEITKNLGDCLDKINKCYL